MCSIRFDWCTYCTQYWCILIVIIITIWKTIQSDIVAFILCNTLYDQSCVHPIDFLSIEQMETKLIYLLMMAKAVPSIWNFNLLIKKRIVFHWMVSLVVVTRERSWRCALKKECLDFDFSKCDAKAILQCQHFFIVGAL